MRVRVSVSGPSFAPKPNGSACATGVTPKHNPEFTSCEFYQAYADLDSLIETTEQLLLCELPPTA